MVSSASAPDLPPSLQATLDKLRKLNTLNIQSAWRWLEQDITVGDIFSTSVYEQWAIASLNERQHIAWEKGKQPLWLTQTIVVPTDSFGYPLTGLTLRLSLTWWAEDAQIYVDGTLIQSGDLFECFTRICLSDRAQPGNTFQIAIRLISPQHDNGALVRSHLTYELLHQPTPEPSFIADELTVLYTLEPSSQSDIQSALSQLDWQSLLAESTEHSADNLWQSFSSAASLPPATVHPFQQSLSQLRRSLLSYSSALKQRTIHCVGHAHLDMAWLWPIADTWNAAERTFQSVLNLQKEFPQLTYTHSSPALFEWIEHNRPDLFQQVQAKVKEGTWSIDAGLWVEPELNIVGGEAIVRHILYGQRYCQQKFGAISKIAWLPDTFGFCWQLPQLLVQGGIETFATLKLTWNDTTEFPHQLFWWQSPDGTRIRSIMLPPIGADIDPIEMTAHAAHWENSTQTTDTLWLPGLGDHGGGPTRDMLEKSQRWEKSPFFPCLSFTTPNQYLSHFPLAEIADAPLPVWNSELYLELHRGCYTTHADQKQHNRQCEDLLYQAEAFATIAMLIAQQPYPQQKIEQAWKTLLFNQFHDILPGTSIPEVFAEADVGWNQVKQIGHAVLTDSLNAISANANLSTPHPEATPVLIFNPLTWPRSSVVTVTLSDIDPSKAHLSWAVCDPEQNEIASQHTSDSSGVHQVLFLARNIPALGYRCYWLTPTARTTPEVKSPDDYRLDNALITVTISSETGEITSLIEKETGREVLSSPGNQLQLFQDESGYWDAWDIATDYLKHPLPSPKLTAIHWHEFGPIRQCIRTTHQTARSLIQQDYILDSHSPFLTIRQRIQWNETHVLLKVKFPLLTSATYATYEMPFGSIERPTQPETDAEQAKWEAPALRWADLSQDYRSESFGVSILTQAKHGFDTSPNHIRLTLLKSSTWPDPNADRGIQHITYAIYPHTGTWRSARTTHQAQELNLLPIVYIAKSCFSPKVKALPTERSFLQVHSSNFIVSALKPSENHPNKVIVRGYEAYGQSTNVSITNTLELPLTSKDAEHINILETNVDGEKTMQLQPYQVASYQTTSKKPS